MNLSEKIKRSITGKKRYAEEEMETKQYLESFKVQSKEVTLSVEEKSSLRELLESCKEKHSNVATDYKMLEALTGEIKAINHQSVLLHGQRIYEAQKIFKSYEQQAFSTWLKDVYGNRQTPYNFLKYFLFYSSLDIRLKEKALSMPKQIIYTIASRNCSDKDKERVVDTYDGESKETYLKAIRKAFPLKKNDRRVKKDTSFSRLVYLLKEAKSVYESKTTNLSLKELRELDAILKNFTRKLWED